MKDIVQRNAVRDPALLEQIVRFLADNIGNPVSTSKISGYLTSQGRKTTPGTVDNYLKMLRDSYIFYRADRYDIKGKLYLKGIGKILYSGQWPSQCLAGVSRRRLWPCLGEYRIFGTPAPRI